MKADHRQRLIGNLETELIDVKSCGFLRFRRLNQNIRPELVCHIPLSPDRTSLPPQKLSNECWRVAVSHNGPARRTCGKLGYGRCRSGEHRCPRSCKTFAMLCAT